MNFAGEYKLVKVRRMNDDDSAVVFVDVEKALAAENDDHDRRELQRDMDTLLCVSEEGYISYKMPLPPGCPVEEVEKAGLKLVDGMVIVREEKGKIENDALYIYDKSKFLAGTEWVKISTDVEGELNLVLFLYKKI